MKILVLAPHPFFQDRGTPIDVLLVLRVLAERKHLKVDLLTYNEGVHVALPNLTIHRTPDLTINRGIRPGFSIKKMMCDMLMFFKAWIMVHRNRYDLIHAGEEAVFIAIAMKLLYRIPYAYDMDSSIAQQMVEQIPKLSIFRRLFDYLEAIAIRFSLITFPVCNALAELCKQRNAKMTVTLHDISQLKDPDRRPTGVLRAETGATGKMILYCGNLEHYQGIDLLLESFSLAVEKSDDVDLVVIGGQVEDIRKYSAMAKRLGIAPRTHFLGPRPFDRLDEYLAEADILVAPRISGINTPMKIFPYMHSGKPVLLTDLYTHSQLLSKNEAYLAPPEPVGFAEGIVELVRNEGLRARLGASGRRFVEMNHSYEAHRERLNRAYDWIEGQIRNKDR